MTVKKSVEIFTIKNLNELLKRLHRSENNKELNIISKHLADMEFTRSMQILFNKIMKKFMVENNLGKKDVSNDITFATNKYQVHVKKYDEGWLPTESYAYPFYSTGKLPETSEFNDRVYNILEMNIKNLIAMLKNKSTLEKDADYIR